MKSVIKNNLLVLAPCAKRLGVVVFSQKELSYFAVKTLKATKIGGIEGEVSRIVQEIIKEFTPEKIVIKQPGKQQTRSNNLQSIRKRIIRQIEAAKIFRQEISFEIAKKHLCPNKKTTGLNAFKTLSGIYPELSQFVDRPSLWQVEYYNSLLSAAAIGFYSLEQNPK